MCNVKRKPSRIENAGHTYGLFNWHEYTYDGIGKLKFWTRIPS